MAAVGNVHSVVLPNGNEYDIIAKDLRTEEKTEQGFLFRQTADGELDWTPNAATIDRIKGKTIAWNQLVRGEGREAGGITATLNNGVYTLSGEASSAYSACINQSLRLLAGHKYILYVAVLANPNSLPISVGLLNASKYGTQVFEVATTADTSIGVVDLTAEADYTGVKFCVCLTDLTLLGLGDLTANQFRALYPALYYAPASVLKSNDAAALLTDGRNQWDEVWEIGAVRGSDGTDTTTITNSIRSVGYIPIFPNTTYYVRSEFSGICYRRFYDADKNYLGESTTIETNANEPFVTPSGAAYMRFYMNAAYGTTYKNDLCINLSDASFNGTYEPYWQRVLALRLSELTGIPEGGTEADRVTIAPNGVKSAGSVYDEIVGNKFIKRVGSVDLGSLTWDYSSGRFSALLSTMTQYASGSGVLANICCSKYSIITASQWYAKSAIGIAQSAHGYGAAHTICVNDTNYSDAATFKTAMDGVMLYYELATPITYDLDEPLCLAYKCDAGGTEKILPENGSAPVTATFRADIQYGVTSGDLVDCALPDNRDLTNPEYIQIFGSNSVTHKVKLGDIVYKDTNGEFVAFRSETFDIDEIPSGWTYFGPVISQDSDGMARVLNGNRASLPSYKYLDVCQYSITAISSTSLTINLRMSPDYSVNTAVTVSLSSTSINATTAQQISDAVAAKASAVGDTRAWWAYLADADGNKVTSGCTRIIIQCDTCVDYRFYIVSATGCTISHTTWGDMPESSVYYKNNNQTSNYRGLMNIARGSTYWSTSGRTLSSNVAVGSEAGNTDPMKKSEYTSSSYAAAIRAAYPTYEDYLTGEFLVKYPQTYGCFGLPKGDALTSKYGPMMAPTKSGGTKAKFPALNWAYLQGDNSYLWDVHDGTLFMEDGNLAVVNAVQTKHGKVTISNGTHRWFAQRYNVSNAWLFGGGNGDLNYTGVYYAFQVGAVSLLRLK